MLTLATLFFSSFVIALSGALMPGPLLTVSINESFRRGPIAGPLLMVGHAVLEGVLVGALLLGLAPYLNKEGFIIAISLLGGAILIWMSYGMLRNLTSLKIQPDSSPPKAKNLVSTGILMSVANPYWTIWWATIGLGYILYSKQFGIAGVFAFFIGHISADFLWYCSVSVLIGKGKSFLNDKAYKILIAICAGFLLIFALYLIVGVVLKFSNQ